MLNFIRRYPVRSVLFLLLTATLAALPLIYTPEEDTPNRMIIDYTGQSFTAINSSSQTIAVWNSTENQAMTLELEEYLMGVAAAEMPADFASEAQKAQAVAARTYALYCIGTNTDKHPENAPLCTDYACCKAWISPEEAAERYGNKQAEAMFDAARAAVASTQGEYLSFDDQPACTVFHSSSDGRTESAENVWGYEFPYLISVSTPEVTEEVSLTFTLVEAGEILRSAGYSPDPSALPSLVRSETGRVETLTLMGIPLSGTEARTLFGLRSSDFSLSQLGDTMVFVCSGYGHGVGMSQYGADALADEGWDYVQILSHYYPGCQLISE